MSQGSNELGIITDENIARCVDTHKKIIKNG